MSGRGRERRMERGIEERERGRVSEGGTEKERMREKERE